MIALLSVVSLLSSPSLQAEEKNPVLKAMSFNIRYGTARDGENIWENRKDFVVETIKSFSPDLLGTQEVLKFQADHLKKNLKGYGFHGVGRDNGAEKGEYTAIYYKVSRFEVLDAGHFWLSESPDTPGSVSWDSSMTRMASWIMVDDLKDSSETPIVFANTHFDHRGQKARHESAKLIRATRDELEEDLPVIVVGDFNMTQDSDGYKVLTNSSDDDYLYGNLLDSYRIIHPERSPNEATFSAFKNVRKGNRIDFVFHSPHLKTINAWIDYSQEDGRNPSDHYPVGAILRLK